MKIFVTGATGFIGGALVVRAVEQGHRVVALVRPGESASFPSQVERVVGDPTEEGAWQDAVAQCDAAVNLAGAPVFTRWNREAKDRIRNSRVGTTRHLVDAIPSGRSFSLASASAVGIYGDAGERELTEDAPLGNGFLARVAREWEAEARRAEEKGVRTMVLRFGIVLDRGGGAFSQLQSMSKKMMGGPVGPGRQWFSWIHRRDLVRAILFLLERSESEGIYNVSAPEPARQIDVARKLGRLLHKPSFASAPSFAVRMVLGEAADLVLNSQKMVPRRLLQEGFSFEYPSITDALEAILDDENP